MSNSHEQALPAPNVALFKRIAERGLLGCPAHVLNPYDIIHLLDAGYVTRHKGVYTATHEGHCWAAKK